MSQPRLQIEISPAGTVQIEALDCTGEQCVSASEPIEIVLGGISKREDKPERYEAPAASTATAIQRQF